MTTETVRQLDRKRFEALLAQDADALAELCHPELMLTHTDGAPENYESYLRKIRESAWVFQRIDHPVHRISLVGDTAVVLGEMDADFTVGGAVKHLSNITLAVWVREDGKWRMLAFHPTPKQ
ncbi:MULTISPECIES: nuclear transport factor 2 family protein [Thermomonosporaceae]|uniref:nuclear transport factor 2 family protein n=1 Tax=Thermomonosporaceae TaxID=2012 RepID=UPI00255A89D7|nr:MULTISPECIES: nuclear transport factor 2 family protein [Thermomonosporaceae]MDL4773932.1 nuclear transport factor 2 family protein [Actinomadura xylanilytica]